MRTREVVIKIIMIIVIIITNKMGQNERLKKKKL